MRFLKILSFVLSLNLIAPAAFAGPELVCGSQVRNFRANFTATMNRMLVAPYPKSKYEASISGNTDGRPGTFDRIFTRAVLESSKERIRMESLEQGPNGQAVFVLDVNPATMTGYLYTADASQGGVVAIPTDISKLGISVRCFWRSHPGCNCGSPNGSSGCSSGGSSGGVCR